MDLSLSKSNLLHMLKEKGYIFEIETINNSKHVKFNHRHAKEPYKIQHCYSVSFTNTEIELDLVYKMLKWSGLKIKIILDY